MRRPEKRTRKPVRPTRKTKRPKRIDAVKKRNETRPTRNRESKTRKPIRIAIAQQRTLRDNRKKQPKRNQNAAEPRRLLRIHNVSKQCVIVKTCARNC